MRAQFQKGRGFNRQDDVDVVASASGVQSVTIDAVQNFVFAQSGAVFHVLDTTKQFPVEK